MLEEGKSRVEADLQSERNVRIELMNQFHQHVLAMETRYHEADLLTHAHINRLNEKNSEHIANKQQHIAEASEEVETLRKQNS